jgi:hypothetical protein
MRDYPKNCPTNADPEHQRGHSWYGWRQTSECEFDLSGYRYESNCQMLGCDATRYCENLVVPDDLRYEEKS